MLGTSAAAGVALVAGIVGIIVGVAGVVSVIIVLAKQNALETSLELFTAANGELREQVESGRQERHDMRLEFEQKLGDERAECARALGALQGQITALTNGLGTEIASAALSAFREGQASTQPSG